MIKMTIEGMMCQHCASRVRKALEALGCKVEIELENKCALISDAAGAGITIILIVNCSLII